MKKLILIAFAVIFASVGSAGAQTYPTRLITMIVPLADGGPTDVVARLLAERMRGMLGQPVIIENVTGAEGSIGIGRAAHATHRRLLVAPLSARKSSLREGPTGTALASGPLRRKTRLEERGEPDEGE